LEISEKNNFRNFQNFRTFGKPCFQTFRTFSKLFPNFFQTFSKISKLFDPKTGFFDSKTQTLRTFFEIFEIYVHFWIISELFSELKFLNFFAKILRVREFRFFPISELWQPNISETHENEKFGKFRLTQGLNNYHVLSYFLTRPTLIYTNLKLKTYLSLVITEALLSRPSFAGFHIPTPNCHFF